MGKADHLEGNFNQMSEAVKFDEGKAKWSLLPNDAIAEVAKIFMMGEKKYGTHNWLSGKGLEWSRLYDAMMRHATAFWGGEDIDPESGLPHMAHAAWNALALLTYILRSKGVDNRYYPIHITRELCDTVEGSRGVFLGENGTFQRTMKGGEHGLHEKPQGGQEKGQGKEEET